MSSDSKCLTALVQRTYLKITVDISEFMILNMVYQQIVRLSSQTMNRVLVGKTNLSERI